MKLNDEQISQVQEQTGATPISDANPALEQIKSQFGDHTFYLSDQGLIVWEPVDDDAQPLDIAAIQVAAWSDEDKNSMTVHEPRATSLILRLAA
jgi:hypothetical protein